MQIIGFEGLSRRIWLYVLPLLGLMLAAEASNAAPRCRSGVNRTVQWTERDLRIMRDENVSRTDAECGWAVCKQELQQEIAYRLNLQSQRIMFVPRTIEFTRSDDFGFSGQALAWIPSRPTRTQNGQYSPQADGQPFFDAVTFSYSASISGTECTVGRISDFQTPRWQ